LTTFNAGKKNIETAITMEPDNAEIRLVRLSIQTNAPAFLFYSQQITIDTVFLLENRNKIKSSALISILDALLKK
jgi:hypothetical protein